jgi:hypothetical protein
MTNGDRLIVGISLALGIGSLIAAGALWMTRVHHAPPNVIVQAPPPQPAPNVIVQAPSPPAFPAPVPSAIPASPPPDLFSADKGRKVTRIDVDMKKEPKPVVKKKARKGSSVKKLRSKWTQPATPQFLGGIFNVK